MTFLRKALSHKYLFKIPTGKTGKRGKPLYRYIYKYAGSSQVSYEGGKRKTRTDVNPSLYASLFRQGVEVGTAFRDAGQGEAHAGHWVVVSVDPARGWHQEYELRHDETGQTIFASILGLERMAEAIHNPKIEQEARRRDLRRAAQVKTAVDAYRARWPTLPEDLPDAVESRKHRARLRSLILLAQRAGSFDYLDVVGASPPGALTVGAKPLEARLVALRERLGGAFASDRQMPADLVDAGDFELAAQAAYYWRAVGELRGISNAQRDALAQGKAKGALAGIRLYDAANPPDSAAMSKKASAQAEKLFEAYQGVIDAKDAQIPARVAALVKAIGAAYPDPTQTRIFLADFFDFDDKKNVNARLAYRTLLSQGVQPVHTTPRASPMSPYVNPVAAEVSHRDAFLLTDTPAALGFLEDELAAHLLADHNPSPLMIGNTRRLLGTNIPNVLVRAAGGQDYHVPAKDLAPRLLKTARARLDARASRHRAEVGPKVAAVQAELEGGLVKRLSQQLRKSAADALRPLAVDRGVVSAQDFDDATRASVAGDVPITDALLGVGVGPRTLMRLSSEARTDAGDTAHNLRLVRAVVDHFHAKWGVPSTDANPARLADFAALPDWNNDVASGTLPHHRADDYARMVHPGLLPKMQTLHVKRIDPTSGGAKVRAFATAHVPLVDERDDHAVFWHEASHVVEGASRELGSRTKDFLLHRIEKSGDFDYKPTSSKHPDEKGYRDTFLDRYVGRWYYRDGMGNESADHASEVLSMGATYMGENAQRLRAARPRAHGLHAAGAWRSTWPARQRQRRPGRAEGQAAHPTRHLQPLRAAPLAQEARRVGPSL